MVCIYCGNKTKVSNSRSASKGLSTWRRRECLHCQSVITTREQIDLYSALRVRDTAGRLRPFLRDKLLLSLHRSLSHRKTATSDATELTDTILNKLMTKQSAGSLEVDVIIDTADQILKRFDRAAAVHYLAHHDQ